MCYVICKTEGRGGWSVSLNIILRGRATKPTSTYTKRRARKHEGRHRLKLNSKRLSWSKLPVLSEERSFRRRIPFLIHKHHGAPQEQLKRHSTQASVRGLSTLWCTWFTGQQEQMALLSNTHEKLLSSPKHETQNVRNYTSLSCQNRARNVEYASTNYNDFKISQK